MLPDIEAFAQDAFYKLSMVKTSIEKLERAVRLWAYMHKLNRRVLVVGDDGLAEGLSESIRRYVGVDVDSALSTEEAFESWKSHRHAVIVAGVMTNSHIDTFRLLSDIGRGPRAIIYSEKQISETTRNAARMADAQVVKISAEQALMARVRELLNEAVPVEH